MFFPISYPVKTENGVIFLVIGLMKIVDSMISNFGQLLLICPAGMDFSGSFPHFKLNNMNWAGFQHLSENEKKRGEIFSQRGIRTGMYGKWSSFICQLTLLKEQRDADKRR